MKARKPPSGGHSRAGQLNFDFTRWRCDCNETAAIQWLNYAAEMALVDPENDEVLADVVGHYLEAVRLEPVR